MSKVCDIDQAGNVLCTYSESEAGLTIVGPPRSLRLGLAISPLPLLRLWPLALLPARHRRALPANANAGGPIGG